MLRESMLIDALEEANGIIGVVTLFDRLDLDRGMVNIVLYLEQLCDYKQRLTRVARADDMGGKDWLLVGKGPKMEVVNFFHKIKLITKKQRRRLEMLSKKVKSS